MTIEPVFMSGTLVVLTLLFGGLIGMVVQAYIDSHKTVKTIFRLEEEALSFRTALLPFAQCEEYWRAPDVCGKCDGCRATDTFMSYLSREG